MNIFPAGITPTKRIVLIAIVVGVIAGAGVVSHLLTGEKTIFRQQVPTKAQSGAHRGEYDRAILEKITVRDVMIGRERLVTVTVADTPFHVRDLVATTGHNGFPVLDGNRMVGIVTSYDLRNIPAGTGGDGVVLPAIMTKNPYSIHPQNTLEDALACMVTHNIHHVPVVSPDSSSELVGFLTRTDLLKAYARESRVNSESRKNE